MVFAFAGDSTITRSPLFFAIPVRFKAAKKGRSRLVRIPGTAVSGHFPFRGRIFSTYYNGIGEAAEPG
jgi:hypothetical protein